MWCLKPQLRCALLNVIQTAWWLYWWNQTNSSGLCNRIIQAKILECVSIPFLKGFSWPRELNPVLSLLPTDSLLSEPPEKPPYACIFTFIAGDVNADCNLPYALLDKTNPTFSRLLIWMDCHRAIVCELLTF